MGKKQLGRIIKQKRKELKLTMRELAVKANVDRTYISKIESRGLIPTYHVLLKIEEALSTELQTFYFEKMAPNALILSPENNRKLSPPQISAQAKLLALIDRLASAPSTPSFQDTLNAIESYFPERANDHDYAKTIIKELDKLKKVRNSIAHRLSSK